MIGGKFADHLQVQKIIADVLGPLLRLHLKKLISIAIFLEAPAGVHESSGLVSEGLASASNRSPGS